MGIGSISLICILQLMIWCVVGGLWIILNDIEKKESRLSSSMIAFLSFFWFIVIPIVIIIYIIYGFVLFFKGFIEFINIIPKLMLGLRQKKEKSKCSVCENFSIKYNKHLMICNQCEKFYDINSLKKVNEILEIRKDIKNKL